MEDYAGVIAAGINALSQFGTGLLNNEMASWREENARHENYRINELAAKNADARTRALYADLQSPAAMLRQYQEAGLSPSLMFGGQGMGAQPSQGAQSAGASGVSPTTFGMSALDIAELQLLNAQTRKTNAEADVVEPTANASIEQMLADAGLKKASTAVAGAQKAGLDLDNYIKEGSKDASIYMIVAKAEEAGYKAETAYEELRSAKVLAEVNEATLAEQIAIKKKELEKVSQAILESKSMTHLNEELKRKAHNEILAMWEQLDINWKQLEVDQQRADTYGEWIKGQLPILAKQLDVRLKELGIEENKMIIEAVTGTIKSLAMGAMAAASFKGGQGSLTQPKVQDVLGKPRMGGNAVNKGPHTYETDYTWAF